MSDTVPSHHGRGKILFASLLILGASVLAVSLLIAVKGEPAQKEVSASSYTSVSVKRLSRSVHPIQVEVFGSAQAAKSVKLQAPFAGTVTAVSDLHLGKKLKANEALFSLEKVKLDLSIREFGVQLEELEIKRVRLSREDKILQARIETAKELYEVAIDSEEKEKERLAIQQQLFDNFKELYDKDTISFNEYLEAEGDLRQIELAVLTAKTSKNSRKDNLEQLKQSLNINESSLSNIENEKELLEIQIAESENDLQKAVIDVDFPCQIVELFIDREQEVTAGTQLATVRSIDASQLLVNVPDAYFRWLYEGELLHQATGTTDWDELITIELVNQEFPKQFKGGYLKAVGESVAVPSRSLPILIERKNPLDEEGQAIPQEALRPGMYCKVTLNLDRVPGTFLIPPGALQIDGRILHGIPDPNSELWSLAIADEVEILHEGVNGIVVRLGDDLDELWIIEDPIRAPKAGTPLKVTRMD